MKTKIMKPLYLILITLFVVTQLSAIEQKGITTDVLSKTTMSWNGATLPVIQTDNPKLRY